MTNKPDLHQEITDRFIAALETGTKPWERDWLSFGEPLRSTGEAYRGINWLMLSLIGERAGYANPYWMTFKQALDLGGCVRKGEKSSEVVFFKRLEVDGEREGAGDDGEPGKRFIPLLRSYRVFNVEQIDGLPEGKFPLPAAVQLPEKERDARAETALRATGASIAEDGGARAYYDRLADAVHLPKFELFRSTGGFLATMAHELVHWTGAPHRLDRVKGARFGDKDYAFEELVAEIGSSFICARLGVAGEHFESHAAYVASWLQALRNDKKAIFKAAALAQVAADLILGDVDRPAVPAPAAVPARRAPKQAAAVPQFQLAL
jgi:antirestriction protein ArdC